MNENQPQQELTKKERAEIAGKDAAEIAAKNASRYYGGPIAGKVTDKALNTKTGQKIVSKAGKNITKIPGMKTTLSKVQPTLSQNKDTINSVIGSLSSGNISNQKPTNSMANNMQDNKSIGNNNKTQENNGMIGSNLESQKGNAEITGLPKKRAKTKKIAIISGISSFISLLMFLVIFIAPLLVLGIIDIDDLTDNGGSGNSGIGYTEVESSYWWPIGGSEITEKDGKQFATGNPTCTYISSPFGLRTLDNASNNHSGMDISCSPSNQHNVIATLDGTVELVVNSYAEGRNQAAGYGNYVKIKHNNGDTTIYAHMYLNSITVNVGDHVEQGQVLGKMGNSGNSTGTHLHFEIRSNGTTAVDPANYISSSNPRPKKSSVDFINGNSNKQSVCLTLKTNGFSTNGTIALMTNINHESSFNPNALGDGGTSYGLCQWHNERYTNLQNSFPNTYQTIDGQIQYLMYELQNFYSKLYSDLKNGNIDENELAYQFCKNFERPADTEKTCRTRGNNAVNFSNYVKNNCQ